MYVFTVPLNYNFISTCVDTHGNTRYFACKMPKFPMENIISTWWDMALWLFYETRHGISTWHDQPNGIWDNYYYVPHECSYLQLKLVSECPVYIPFCHAYYAFLLKFFQLLILLGKFLNICPPYYILEWHDWLITMWVCPYCNGA